MQVRRTPVLSPFIEADSGVSLRQKQLTADTLTNRGAGLQIVSNIDYDCVSFVGFNQRAWIFSIDDHHLAQITVRG